MTMGRPEASAFRGGEAARLADEEIGHLHPAVHFVGVADDAEGEAGIGRFDGAGLLFHAGLHVGVLAANDDGLRGVAQAGEAVEHTGGGADAERAAGDEEERAVGIEAGLAAQIVPISRSGRRRGRWGCR